MILTIWDKIIFIFCILFTACSVPYFLKFVRWSLGHEIKEPYVIVPIIFMIYALIVICIISFSIFIQFIKN